MRSVCSDRLRAQVVVELDDAEVVEVGEEIRRTNNREWMDAMDGLGFNLKAT
jgi:hypothetical protein